MTYTQFERKLQNELQQLYDTGEAATITDWVMEEITGYTRFLRRPIQHEIIPLPVYCKLETAQEELLKHKPVQYVLGYAPFCGMKFLVNESVLIPRPETEELVEWIVQTYRDTLLPLKIADIGTGSGCIAIALKKKLTTAIVGAMDLSDDALQVAMKNAALNDTEIHFRQSDFLDDSSWLQLSDYEIIVSNPPYIPQQEKNVMDKNITAWEPETALFVPDNDPLLFYKKIADFGKTHLQKNGVIFLETHQDYAGAVQELFTAAGYIAVIKKDMHGNDRMVKAVNRKS